MRILIVDDDSVMLRAASRELSHAGHACFTTTQPPPVIVKGSLDVALLDWSPHGPAMIELCKTAGVPFVVFTADPDRVTTGLAVVSKPYERGALEAALTAVYDGARLEKFPMIEST